MAAAPPRSVADATHELYRQYGKQIYAYCLHQLRNREEAEDAVQTTFLNAFRGLQRGTTTRFEQAWLYKIAQNVCIARRSSSGRRLKLEAPDDFEILQEVVPSGASGGDGDTLELMGLDSALDSMPENQRRAILLREWQGLSYREIATELGLTQGAVEMLIFRARRTLAMALEQPEAAERKRGRAKTGFSFGSLIAAMKSLFSGGAALKMAAVAVSAAVVGTNAVHSVVHQAFAPARHAHRTSLAASVASTPAVGGTKVAARLVAYRTSHPYAAAVSAPAAASPASTASSPGHDPVLADAATAATATAATPAQPDASATGAPSAQSASPVVMSAPAAVAAPAAASASGTNSPPSTSTGAGSPRSGPSGKSPSASDPTPPTVSKTGPGGTSSSGSDNGHHHGSGHGHGQGSGNTTGTAPGDGSTDQPTQPQPQGPVATPYAPNGGPTSPTTSTVPVATPYDPSSGAQGPPASTTTTDTTTTTTTTTDTTQTTTTSDGGDSSSSGSSDGGNGGGGGGDHGHHHGDGGGDNGNGGGNGGGNGHHHGH
jgi:RNA polymerase sigma factor (sigma-70 family)